MCRGRENRAAAAGGKSRRAREEHLMKNQTFGIEIETTGIGREATAKALAAYFGTTARYVGAHLSNWEVPMPDGRYWTVERDGSVTDPSAEVVSPVCTWEDIEMVQEVARTIRRAGGCADSSCGIHIHIGLGEHTPKTLRNLVNIVNAKEDFLAEALGIAPYRRGRWCKPVEPEFLEHLNRKKPTTMDAFAALWYAYSGSQEDTVAEARATHYDASRYHLLNLHATFSTERPAPTIEFRAFNGTLHAGKIKAYIQLCMAISHKALTSASASSRRLETDNPAYAFRCWLLQLGLIGEEFKTARLHLLKNLPGNAAWRHGNPTQRRGEEEHSNEEHGVA